MESTLDWEVMGSLPTAAKAISPEFHYWQELYLSCAAWWLKSTSVVLVQNQHVFLKDFYNLKKFHNASLGVKKLRKNPGNEKVPLRIERKCRKQTFLVLEKYCLVIFNPTNFLLGKKLFVNIVVSPRDFIFWSNL